MFRAEGAGAAARGELIPSDLTRRDFSAAGVALAANTAPGYWALTPERIRRFDDALENLFKQQTTDSRSPWVGGVPDADGLHNGGSATSAVIYCVTAMAQAKSRFTKAPICIERLRLALQFLKNHTSPEGNLDLLITNFNSPPDTAFAMQNLCSALQLARMARLYEVEKLLAPVVKWHAAALVTGGVHTPNHRWVVCAALAQAYSLFPEPDYLRRIDQWFAEGIDIDADGQFSERSTNTYNSVTCRALTIAALKLNRPQLLDPVRRNLEAIQYFLHPGFDVATEISTRQDQYTRGTMGGYWLALRHLAVTDRIGAYETLARQGSPAIWELTEYPHLQQAGPNPAPLPENYEKLFPLSQVARIRRGLTSASILLGGTSRFFALRRGDAQINAVRFASAFFGKGQFIPKTGEKRDDRYEMAQDLDAGYYQPVGRAVNPGERNWYASYAERERTQLCRMRYQATVAELDEGFSIRVRAAGTNQVPLAIEINLREGGKIEGAEPVRDSWLLKSGYATYTYGRDRIRIGPGRGDHRYIAVRGAEPKLAGPTLFLTLYTPVDHTFELRFS